MSHCEECMVCKECGRDAFCLAEVVPSPWPCPHWEPICGDCWPNGCRECERDVELADHVAAAGPPEDLTRVGVQTAAEVAAQWRDDLERRAAEKVAIAAIDEAAQRRYDEWLESRA